jgi:hypothetical protein
VEGFPHTPANRVWTPADSLFPPKVIESAAYHSCLSFTNRFTIGGVMKVPKHIFWSCAGNTTVDLADPQQKKWWLSKVLTHGTITDVRALDLDEISEVLSSINLPRHVHHLWRDYFDWRDSQSISQEGAWCIRFN